MRGGFSFYVLIFFFINAELDTFCLPGHLKQRHLRQRASHGRLLPEERRRRTSDAPPHVGRRGAARLDIEYRLLYVLLYEAGRTEGHEGGFCVEFGVS